MTLEQKNYEYLTPEEWCALKLEYIRQNHRRDFRRTTNYYPSDEYGLSGFINAYLSWGDSPQGIDFWSGIYRRLRSSRL